MAKGNPLILEKDTIYAIPTHDHSSVYVPAIVCDPRTKVQNIINPSLTPMMGVVFYEPLPNHPYKALRAFRLGAIAPTPIIDRILKSKLPYGKTMLLTLFSLPTILIETLTEKLNKFMASPFASQRFKNFFKPITPDSILKAVLKYDLLTKNLSRNPHNEVAFKRILKIIDFQVARDVDRQEELIDSINKELKLNNISPNSSAYISLFNLTLSNRTLLMMSIDHSKVIRNFYVINFQTITYNDSKETLMFYLKIKLNSRIPTLQQAQEEKTPTVNANADSDTNTNADIDANNDINTNGEGIVRPTRFSVSDFLDMIDFPNQ